MSQKAENPTSRVVVPSVLLCVQSVNRAVTREMYLLAPHRYYNFKSQSRWKSFFLKTNKINSGLLKYKKGEIRVVLHTQSEVDFRLFDSLFLVPF